jgi:hypothetical protein
MDQFIATMISRSLPKNLEPENMCFSHLENRDRPSVIEGNVPWWLAATISVPLLLITLIYIRKR